MSIYRVEYVYKLKESVTLEASSKEDVEKMIRKKPKYFANHRINKEAVCDLDSIEIHSIEKVDSYYEDIVERMCE